VAHGGIPESREEGKCGLSKSGLFCLKLSSKMEENQNTKRFFGGEWIMPVIPATLEAETGGQPGKIN
jgi:hypothetical protein